MKKNTIWILSTLMALALLGVCAVQYYYIRQSYVLKSQLFDQMMNQVLQNVVDKYQKHEVASHLNKRNEMYIREHIEKRKQMIENYENFKLIEEKRIATIKLKHQKEIEDYLNEQDSLIRTEFIGPIIISENDYKALLLGDKNKARLTYDIQRVVDENGKVYANVQRNFESNEKTYKLTDNTLPDTIRYLATDKVTGEAVYIELPKVPDYLEKKFKMEDRMFQIRQPNDRWLADTVLAGYDNFDLIKDVASEMRNKDIPFKSRVNVLLIDSLIHTELTLHDLPLQYSFTVASARKDSMMLGTSKFVANINHIDQEKLANSSQYTSSLFKNEIFRDPGLLRIFLPGKNALIFSNMMPTLLTSSALILVLILIFTYTIVSIVKQKKLAEMKIDFINNMTHEFKTPVSTIMIASESLRDADLNKDLKRVQRLANIIYDENVRLGHNIERVLNIARLEKNSLNLAKNLLDFNSLVEAVVDSMQLQLQKKNAEVIMQLCDEECELQGDELHLSNIIFNLIDNAIKYSLGTPLIEISTRKTKDNVVFTIRDNGIGMTKEQQKRIFDQFYRVPTGNLHDVKGFGLGLNYVQFVVKEMHGRIKLKSEKDKGSQFEVTLPTLN